MADFQIRDLASAAGFAAVAYGLFNVLISFGSGRPVAEWINPHRRYLLPLAAVLFVGAAGLLHRGSLRYTTAPEELLVSLVREERAKPEVVGCVSFALFATSMAALYFWCRWLYPRDPSTFSPASKDLQAEYRKAMRHYVRWSHQLDYAALFVVEDERVEKTVHYALRRKLIFARMNRVDSMKPSGSANLAKTVSDQLIRWDELARRCVAQWDGLDALVAPTCHGQNVLIFFDLQFGGVFVELVQEFTAASGSKVRIFLFAVCLNQYGLDSATATRYYSMLSNAIRHIRKGSGKPRG